MNFIVVVVTCRKIIIGSEEKKIQSKSFDDVGNKLEEKRGKKW